MNAEPTISISVILGLFRIKLHLNGEVRCPDCEGALDLHQPDPRNPDRILGVCERCSGWLLMDLRPDQTGWIGVPLPDAAFFRDTPEHENRGAVEGPGS